jgi:Flp pilus assembly pilin Flp
MLVVPPTGTQEKRQEMIPQMAGLDLHTMFRAIALAVRPRSQRGQGLVEYALILTLVALVLVFALLAVSGALGSVFGIVATDLNSASP